MRSLTRTDYATVTATVFLLLMALFGNDILLAVSMGLLVVVGVVLMPQYLSSSGFAALLAALTLVGLIAGYRLVALP